MSILERSLKTQEGTIRYRVGIKSSEKPWLVFLSGLSADHTLFEKQMEYFSEQYNCLAWDMPGHGLSRPFLLQFSMADLAQYLHDIFAQEQIVSPFLIGQSLGGYIAQVYMDRFPDSVSGFVSIDSCSLSRKYYTEWELSAMMSTGWMYRLIPWKWLKKIGVSGTAVTSYGRSIMEKSWSCYTKEEYCQLADHGYRIFAQAVKARKEYPLHCPVLLLCGEKDGAGSAKRYNRQWEKRDGHRLIWIPNAGHNANTDAPERVNQLIEEFVLLHSKHVPKENPFEKI